MEILFHFISFSICSVQRWISPCVFDAQKGLFTRGSDFALD